MKRIAIIIFTGFISGAPLLLRAELGATTGVEGGLNANIEQDVSVHVNSVVEIESETNIQTETDGVVDISTKKDKSRTTKETDNETKEMNARHDASIRVNSRGVSVTLFTEVESDEDLAVFAENVVLQNEHIAQINTDASNNDIEVRYRHRGRFFGIVPITVISEIQAGFENSGNTRVKVRFPWWHIFVTGIGTSRNELETNVESRLKMSVRASGEAQARTKAEIIEHITATLNATVTTKANTGVQ